MGRRTQFDRVWLSNSWWRILKADMDTDATNGNQALVIKEQALTAQETGDGDFYGAISQQQIGIHISMMIRPQLVMVKVISKP
jgi:hypothetical protein